jgi:hypothetical protein
VEDVGIFVKKTGALCVELVHSYVKNTVEIREGALCVEQVLRYAKNMVV